LIDRASHLEEGAYLRLRTVQGRVELTHKGPKQALGKDRWRREHTVALGEGPALELLEELGFRPRTRYVKDTAIFRFRGVLVYVDHLEASAGSVRSRRTNSRKISAPSRGCST
jgi:adenylate cyclase class IV